MVTAPLIDRFADRTDLPAVIAPGARCTFAGLVELRRHWRAELERHQLAPGTVVSLEGDYSPGSIALLLALADRAAVVVPHSRGAEVERAARDELAAVEARFAVADDDTASFERTGRVADHALYDELRRRGHPGLVLFSSGSSGEPKAAVHDFTSLLEKFERRRPPLSALAFLSFDHLGGLNTALHALSNGATVVASTDRSPESVCAAIEEHRVELLPATPTFYNLLLLSGAHRRHDLGSLRVISYGAEPMPQTTLNRLREAFPAVRLQQTYGLIEVGALRSKSRGDDSLWVKVGGEGYETRVVDGMLQIRARSMAIGYLNAPAAVTPDGWLVTGDAVLQDGDYLKILGRRSELINVGGEKVYPAEVEGVIEQLDDVAEATVYGEPNGIFGQIVCAKVRSVDGVDADALGAEVKSHCRARLERFKVPVRVRVSGEPQFGDRYKKVRRQGPG